MLRRAQHDRNDEEDEDEEDENQDEEGSEGGGGQGDGGGNNEQDTQHQQRSNDDDDVVFPPPRWHDFAKVPWHVAVGCNYPGVEWDCAKRWGVDSTTRSQISLAAIALGNRDTILMSRFHLGVTFSRYLRLPRGIPGQVSGG